MRPDVAGLNAVSRCQVAFAGARGYHCLHAFPKGEMSNEF